MTALLERQSLVTDIRTARASGARIEEACKEVSISIRTYERWSQGGEVIADGRPDAERPECPWALSEAEQQAVLAVCMEPRFADMPPTQIVPTLADEGVYLASESTFYRLLQPNRRSTTGVVRRYATSESPRVSRPCDIRSTLIS